MVSVPKLMPVTLPVAPMVATALFVDSQVPPVVESEYVVVEPMQSSEGPEIALAVDEAQDELYNWEISHGESTLFHIAISSNLPLKAVGLPFGVRVGPEPPAPFGAKPAPNPDSK